MPDDHTIATFSKALAASGKSFICETPLPSMQAQVRFIGNFKGQATLWDMELQALGDCATQQPSFMDIGETGERGRRIKVGLGVAHIDEAVILKSIIMIRNYKKLRPGRHEWGAIDSHPA